MLRKRVKAHLLQHGADEVGGLEQLQVDVHVEGHLPLLLQLLLLRRLVLVPARRTLPPLMTSPDVSHGLTTMPLESTGVSKTSSLLLDPIPNACNI